MLSDLAAFVESGGELLVVDTGSSDETISMARADGCRVEEVGPRFDTVLDGSAAAEIERRIAAPTEGPLVGAGQRLFHFGEARNHAGQPARCDFVLQLDASDRVPALDVGALDGWIASGGVGAFEYEQEYGSIALRISRFYDRRRYRWEGRVHEIHGRQSREYSAAADHFASTRSRSSSAITSRRTSREITWPGWRSRYWSGRRGPDGGTISVASSSISAGTARRSPSSRRTPPWRTPGRRSARRA